MGRLPSRWTRAWWELPTKAVGNTEHPGVARVLPSLRGRRLARGCRNQQDFRTCPRVFLSQRHSNPFNTVLWVRESGYKLKGKVQTGYKDKLSPHEDSQGTGCPVRLCSPQPCKFSKLSWIKLSVICFSSLSINQADFFKLCRFCHLSQGSKTSTACLAIMYRSDNLVKKCSKY